MSKSGKLLLVLTSMTPVLGACAINAIMRSKFAIAWCYGLVAILLALICFLVILGCQRYLQEEPLSIKKVKATDEEVLAFLLVYLLPLFSQDVVDFTSNPVTAAYVVLIIGVCVYHTNSFSFNPLLAFVGFHFYEVENANGMTYLLITKNTLLQQENDLRVVQLSDYIFLEKKQGP